MQKKYIVRLSPSEQAHYTEVIKKPKGSSQKIRRAQLLLKADTNEVGWPDTQIADAFDCRVQTVENLRKCLALEGFEVALNRKKRANPPRPPKLDGEVEARLLALRLGLERL